MGGKTISALVVGAGISGTRSALDLALMGYKVTLIDKAPFTGGIVIQLDHQFPSDSCGICRMLPMAERDDFSQYCLRRGLFHENIDIGLSTELTALSGEPGNFQARLRRQPTLVDPERCIGCGECGRVCPQEVPDAFNAGLTRRKAIFLPVPYILSNNYVVDTEVCNRCGACEKVCPTKAIDFTAEVQETYLEVGAVILAAGFGSFVPGNGNNPYGYSHPNVVTSLEFERLLSHTGPNGGPLVRPGDGRAVKRMAWFQCVGSRDHQADADFCSSACCMISLKEAMLAKERAEGPLEAHIFYMDMRTFGKNFQRYRQRAEKEFGVHFHRSRVHSIIPQGRQGDLGFCTLDDQGQPVEMVVDLIVLANGQRPSADTGALAEITRIALNPWGFVQPRPFFNSRTNREGIFLSGSFSGLRDISESVIQAGAASLAASGFLCSKGFRPLSPTQPQTVYRDVTWERPRIDVALCTYGPGLSEALDLKEFMAKLTYLEAVDQVHHFPDSHTPEGWQTLKEGLSPSRANRLLIGSFRPHLLGGKLQELGEAMGLNPELMEVIDLRFPLWPGQDWDKKRLDRESFARIAMGIGKLKALVPASIPSVRIDDSVLIVGGGIAGMTAALAIADQGFAVTLVEQSAELGGNLRARHRTLEGPSPDKLLAETIRKAAHHPDIRIHQKARVIQSRGRMGCFTTTIERENGSLETVDHGVTILATGGQEAPTQSYGYGQSRCIVTQGELERQLDGKTLIPGDLTSVAMIQCVDSREEPRNYCSRICCPSALKNALFLKEKNPDMQIVIFYRDLMSYGFMETYYTQARRAGVVFVPYEIQQKPQVRVENGRPIITALDPILQRQLEVQADLLVLSTGIIPGNAQQLAELFDVRVDEDKFFQEEESKWRPLDLTRRGVFTCGLAHSPRSITESIAMAEATALRCLRFLGKARLSVGTSTVARVDEKHCSGCKTCLDLCAFKAVSFDEGSKSAAIDGMLCQGCGVCAAACPMAAISVWNYTPAQMLAQIEGLLVA